MPHIGAACFTKFNDQNLPCTEWYSVITQDDRTCWMEAIQPGSSTAIRSPSVYEMVSSFTEDDRYSYARHVMHEPRPPSTVIYDEPNVPLGSQRAQVKPNPTPAPAEYDEPILTPGPVQAQIEPASQMQTKETHPPTAVEYDEPILTPAQASTQKQSTNWTHSLIQPQPLKEEDSDDDDDEDIYCDVPEE